MILNEILPKNNKFFSFFEIICKKSKLKSILILLFDQHTFHPHVEEEEDKKFIQKVVNQLNIRL